MPEDVDSQIPVYSPTNADTPGVKNSPTPGVMIVLVDLMVLFLLFALGFWLGKGKTPPLPAPVADPGEVLAVRFGQAPTAPSELSFIFFNDVNRNGVFDQEELPFNNVSVEFRRRGQEGAFQAIPADTLGKVVVSGLAPADYEIRYTYADFTGISYGDFNLRTWYQIILPTGGTKQIPSDWESLTEASEIKVGIAEYVPDKLIVGQTRNQLFLVDQSNNQVYGESTIFPDDVWHRFTLNADKVYYLHNNELKQFDIKNKLTQTAIKPAYGIDDFNYRLSPDVKTLIYIDNGELSYITADDWCGQGAIFDTDGYRVLTTSLRINFREDSQLNAVGRVSNDAAEKVYLVGCHDGRFEAFPTDWTLDTIAPEPVPTSWQQGDFRLDILLGEVDL